MRFLYSLFIALYTFGIFIASFFNEKASYWYRQNPVESMTFPIGINKTAIAATAATNKNND